MNIKQAKEQIQNAMKAYFTKDNFGNYLIPVERQRPIFLMGPPGIGKTAIMEQVASELGVGLVANLSYAVWDYRDQPGNLWGQICPLFTVLWIPVALLAMGLYAVLDKKLVRFWPQ